MSNKRKHIGPVSVYLTREQVNALIYLLDCFPAADMTAASAHRCSTILSARCFRRERNLTH